jgi:hypothetical protein
MRVVGIMGEGLLGMFLAAANLTCMRLTGLKMNRRFSGGSKTTIYVWFSLNFQKTANLYR